MTERLQTHEERFTARVTIGSPEQCWLWGGPVLPHTGYATFWPHGRAGGKVYAHRYSYERFVGPIPEGLTLDHLCHTRDLSCPGGLMCLHRRCVNWHHLEPVDMLTQMRRAHHWTQNPDGSWLCSRRHPIDESVVGRRHACPTCFNDYKREWRKVNGGRELQSSRVNRADARRHRFLTEHPELLDQLELVGFVTCAQRIRRGYTFDGAEWIKPQE